MSGGGGGSHGNSRTASPAAPAPPAPGSGSGASTPAAEQHFSGGGGVSLSPHPPKLKKYEYMCAKCGSNFYTEDELQSHIELCVLDTPDDTESAVTKANHHDNPEDADLASQDDAADTDPRDGDVESLANRKAAPTHVGEEETEEETASRINSVDSNGKEGGSATTSAAPFRSSGLSFAPGSGTNCSAASTAAPPAGFCWRLVGHY